jgi:hypothetical protein
VHDIELLGDIEYKCRKAPGDRTAIYAGDMLSSSEAVFFFELVCLLYLTLDHQPWFIFHGSESKL